jgi:hypothetical protein
MKNSPKTRISEYELRGKFQRNEGGYNNRWNELETICTYDESASPKSRQHPGTRSKVLKFREDGNTVMTRHFFLRPDGLLGASGKFDPKSLVINGSVFYA